MTRPWSDLERVRDLTRQGLTAPEIVGLTGVPRRTVDKWRRLGADVLEQRRRTAGDLVGCSCRNEIDPKAYVHLLGLYLGDGTLCSNGRFSLRLEIACDSSYPRLIEEAAAAVASVLPVRVNRRPRSGGCTYVTATSVHWRCLFPQHGPGLKHTRRIELVDWQRALVEAAPGQFVRGLLNSDGCRVVNRVKGGEYLRYQMANKSNDILELFEWACDLIGVRSTRSRIDIVSIARRESVEILEGVVGPKS